MKKGEYAIIRISQITVPIEENSTNLEARAAKLLGISPKEIQQFRIVRQSIDARKKTEIQYVFTVELSSENEEKLVKQAKKKNISIINETKPYIFPNVTCTHKIPPVIVGMGPAGLFAALMLAQAGIASIILERGQDVDSRSQYVERFWQEGKLTESSNVQFGEGGAGTFSDGKLTTGTHDVRMKTVLQTFVKFGAPEDILYSHKPHVGTDVLRTVVKNMRLRLIELGCDVRFEHCMTDLHVENNAVKAIAVEAKGETYTLPCSNLILAPGHSARDTFSMLHRQNVSMEQKPFAIGVRIEHEQADISKAQFGDAWEKVPPSDYKLSCHLPNGRSAFTFCVCPGGEVVAATSQEGQVVTNGMSCRARDGENINGGLLVNVTPADFQGDDPLAGVRFQEQWERVAFQLGGKNYHAPAQLVGDFLADKPSQKEGSIKPTYRPGVTWTELKNCLPEYVIQTLKEAISIFDRKVKGFANPDSVLTGVETRSSSPLRILRDRETLESDIRGIYPCGEGAGYAGGIVSAAADGIRIAEAVVTGNLQEK